MEKAVKFALRLGRAITAKLDYIAQYYGRSRASEINWAIRRHISSFEKEFGKIPLWKKLNHPARGDFFGSREFAGRLANISPAKPLTNCYNCIYCTLTDI